jgi:hypothetical protein
MLQCVKRDRISGIKTPRPSAADADPRRFETTFFPDPSATACIFARQTDKIAGCPANPGMVNAVLRSTVHYGKTRLSMGLTCSTVYGSFLKK